MSDEREHLVPYRPPTLAAATDWRSPLALRVVAFLLILGGVLVITETVLEIVVFKRFEPGGVCAILFLLAGRGLLQWSNGWRRFVLAIAWFYFASACVMVLISILDLLFRNGSATTVRVGSWTGGPWLAPLTGFVIGGIAYSLVRLLSRRDIRWRCENRHVGVKLGHVQQGSWNPLRWRFSLGSMFLATIIVAFVLLLVTADDVLYDTQPLTSSWSSASSNQVHRVDYAVSSSRFFNQPKQLLSAVLSTDGSEEFRVVGIDHYIIGNRQVLTMYTSDGLETTILPSKHQLYEAVDGKLRSRNERVTLEELEDFVKSQPTEWTLDALVKHAQQMRAPQDNAAPR